MGYARSRKFCCCIPVRFGTFIISTLFLFGGGVIAAVGWYGAAHKDQVHLTKNQEVSLVFTSVAYTLLTLASLFGFIGSIIRRRSFVSAYSTVLAWHLGVSIATGAYFIYTLFHKVGEHEINDCIKNNQDSNSALKAEECKMAFGLSRALVIATYVVIWLLQLWGCLIVSDYVGQLREEEALQYPPPAQMTASSQPMATTYNEYSFSKPENGFGGPSRRSNNV
ncbi:hypothetical protein F5148DRAFT_174806 [Russula earlei]|uniref:Uncharacterized protein n=1 Tax=Russula earlei TaxID=71964 RepID=A0ACC0U756_9AGAM|nr:hypothetical protein F5148DRAFT_174806 [Russula earlei]